MWGAPEEPATSQGPGARAMGHAAGLPASGRAGVRLPWPQGVNVPWALLDLPPWYALSCCECVVHRRLCPVVARSRTELRCDYSWKKTKPPKREIGVQWW